MPQNAIAIWYLLQVSMTCPSRMEPPGCTMAVTPLRRARSMLSPNGKKASLPRETPVTASRDVYKRQPLRVAIDTNDADKFADKLWTSLNEDNKVSLFVRSIALETGEYEDIILNKYTAVEG